jgi:hypothetical protein
MRGRSQATFGGGGRPGGPPNRNAPALAPINNNTTYTARSKQTSNKQIHSALPYLLGAVGAS